MFTEHKNEMYERICELEAQIEVSKAENIELKNDLLGAIDAGIEYIRAIEEASDLYHDVNQWSEDDDVNKRIEDADYDISMFVKKYNRN